MKAPATVAAVVVLAAAALALLTARVEVMAQASTQTAPQPAPQTARSLQAADVRSYAVVHVYPHDRDAFTQGLIYRDGYLYESTGLNRRSSLRKVELQTGKIVQQRSVDARYFAEGLTDWGSELFQLTWSTNVGFVYDLASFEPRRTFAYPGEGWGLAHDDRSLIMSDGSSELRFIDPVTMKEQRRMKVLDRGIEVRSLNELEFVRGEILANVWLTDRIAMIDPVRGTVRSWLDLADLYPRRSNGDDVLNGIAYDAAGDRLFVTGKLWPSVFEIRLQPASAR
jgi:glutamine cyclotransferase